MGEPKAQEIAVALLSYRGSSRQKCGVKICPISNAALKGMKKRFCWEQGTGENKDFESKTSLLCFRAYKNNLMYFSKERKTQMTYWSLFLPKIFYNIEAEESTAQHCFIMNVTPVILVLPKHKFFLKFWFLQITSEDACLILSVSFFLCKIH